jgi:hypothetical protein
VSKTACITEAAYAYRMNDTYEDGICCQYGAGKFQITVNVEQVATSSSRYLPDMVRESSFVVGHGTGFTADYRLDIVHDDYPYETRWSLYRDRCC